MSPTSAKRFPSSVSAMVATDQADLIVELSEQEQVSRADVLRDVIRVGLPLVAKEYRKRVLERELQDLSEERTA